MQKILILGMFLVCVITSVTTIIYHKDASRYRAQFNAAQAEAVKLQSDLALSNPTVRVYEGATTLPADVPESAVAETETVPDESISPERIRQLELEIQEKNRLIAALQDQQRNMAQAESRPQRSGQSWEEELKKSDPERYKEMIKQREEARSKIQRSFAEKANHFLKQDTASMTEDEAIEHEEMLAVLENTWALAEQLQAGEVPRDQRWQIMRQMRDNMTTLEPALQEERTKEWYKLSNELGYTGKDADAFVGYLDKIVNVTSMTDIYQTMRRGRGGNWNNSTNAVR